ncbi:hypothetical protein ACIBZJ_05735, partial [Cryptosporangium sp. NPDC051539]
MGADVWNGRTVLAADWSGGRLIAVTVERGELTPWGDGYTEPESLSLVGDDALITERGGILLRQDLTTPGRASAVIVASGLGAAHQVVRTADGAAALVADRAGGRIVRVDLGTGAMAVLVSGLAAPVGVALGPDGAVYVTEQGSGNLTRHAPDGLADVVLSGLVSPFFLSWVDADRSRLLVTERAPAHRVGVVDVTAGAPVLERLVGRGISQPSQAILVEDMLVVTGEQRMLALDASAGVAPGVHVGVPTGPLWPGSWVDVGIDTGVTGWTRPELAIQAEPAGVLTVDEHPGAADDTTRPTVRLLAHATLGPVDVVVRDAASMTEVGRGTVSVGFDPTSPPDGPPMWIESASQTPVLHMLDADLSPGVADAGSLLPKDGTGKVTSVWRVLAVLADTKGRSLVGRAGHV